MAVILIIEVTFFRINLVYNDANQMLNLDEISKNLTSHFSHITNFIDHSKCRFIQCILYR